MGYKEFTQDKSAFNAAMSYTLKRAVTSSGKDITIDFNRALVSMGTLMPVFEGVAMQEDTDIAKLLVYNKLTILIYYHSISKNVFLYRKAH